MNQKNYLGYIRVSTQKQANGHSFARQEDYIKKWVTQNEGNLIGIYRDVNSGSKIGINLEKAIRLCEEYDAILCTEAVDRLDRTGGEIIGLISERGVRFETPELFLVIGGVNNCDIIRRNGKIKDMRRK